MRFWPLAVLLSLASVQGHAEERTAPSLSVRDAIQPSQGHALNFRLVADPQRALMACRGKVRHVQVFVFGDRIEFVMMLRFDREADTLRVPPEFLRVLPATESDNEPTQ